MKVVRLSALLTGRLYPQEISLVLISIEGRVDHQDYTVTERIKSVTPSGIEPATFQFAAQYFNQQRHRVPLRRFLLTANIQRI
jgi:hypothetical protein